MLLVRGDLEHAVGGGVADRTTGADMLFPQPRDDLGAGGVAVPQNAVRARERRDLFGQILGERGLLVREIVPVPRHRHAGQFPVARRSVLARRHLGRRAPEARAPTQTTVTFPAGEVQSLPEAKVREVREVERPGAAVLGPALGRLRGDVAEGVGAGVGRVAVEKPVGIRRATDPDAVEHDQESPRHHPILSRMRSGMVAESPIEIALSTARSAASAARSVAA